MIWNQCEVNTWIDQPVERIFPYLVDPLRWHEFAPACVFRQQIGDEVPVIGSRWRSTDRIGPFRLNFVDELAELEPNRRVVWLSSAPWNARVEYACQPHAGGTRIRAHYAGEMTGWLRLLGFVPPWVMATILGQDFRRLRALLSRRYGTADAPLRAAGHAAVVREPADAME